MKKSLLIRAHYSPANDVTLRNADCRKLLREIPDRSARLIVTSPPYNMGKAYEKRRSVDSYMDEQKEIIAECVRTLKDNGSLCWQVGVHVDYRGQIMPLDILLHPIMDSHGLILRNRIIWHFEHGLHCKRRLSGRYETILWYTKGREYIFNLDSIRVPQKYPGKRAYKGPNKGQFSSHPKGKNPGDVWIFPNVKGNHIEKTEHPCQFPVELAERLVLSFSSEGDLVIDPFVGVGTTLLAALMNNRRSAGAEIVPKYVSIARDRLRQFRKGELKVRPRNKPVFVAPLTSPLRIPPTTQTE